MVEAALAEVVQPLRLDLGCGKRKREGFHGVDSIAFEGVDTVVNLAQRQMFVPEYERSIDGWLKWPWADDSVDEVYSSHFVEHLTGAERIHFFNELGRVLKKGAKAVVITPNWSHACAYGDPTHQWPPMSAWYPLYLNREWRAVNAPHVGYTCDFDHSSGDAPDAWLAGRNPEFVADALAHKTNSSREIHVNLVKR